MVSEHAVGRVAREYRQRRKRADKSIPTYKMDGISIQCVEGRYTIKNHDLLGDLRAPYKTTPSKYLAAPAGVSVAMTGEA